jgi:hypothetical protein
MGLGLLLNATRPKPAFLRGARSEEAWLADVAEWFRENYSDVLEGLYQGRDLNDRTALAVTLHPQAENLEIAAVSGGRIEVSAKTSGTGPGYHVYVCELLDRLAADFELRWDAPDESGATWDETGYFESREVDVVEREMLGWLGGLAQMILESARDSQQTGWIILRGIGEPDYQHDGFVWTPLGPRDKGWLEATARDPRSGIDLFPWWDVGQGAPYHLGRAFSLMWTQVRWRPPIIDEERALLDRVLRHLERAYALDPGGPYPWAEWAELAGYAGRADSLPFGVAARAAQSGQPTIGYRRRPVRVHLKGRWSIEVPGSFAEVETSDSWRGFDYHREVYVSSLALGSKDGAPPPSGEDMIGWVSKLQGMDVLQHAAEGVVGRAEFRPDEGGRIALIGASAVTGSLAKSTITIDEADRDWAIGVWRSIRSSA